MFPFRCYPSPLVALCCVLWIRLGGAVVRASSDWKVYIPPHAPFYSDLTALVWLVRVYIVF